MLDVMSSTIASISSNMSSGSVHDRRHDAESSLRGFTAVNTTIPSPPRSRETSADSQRHTPRQENNSNNDRHINVGFATENNHVASNNKRRRSGSPDGVPLSPPHRYDYHPPKKVELQQQQHLADRALHVLDETDHQQQHAYHTNAPAAQTQMAYSYSRPYGMLNDAAQAGPSSLDSNQADDFSREPSEQHYASSANGQDTEKLEDGAEKHSPLQAGQKRKRNFSNRTKTGCVTCRKRKKKCDEARPICKNCERGNFNCEGYQSNASSRTPNWVKTPSQKDPIPLQSKEVDDIYDGDQTPMVSQAPGFNGPHMSHHVAVDGQEQARPHYPSHPAASGEPRPTYSGQPQHNTTWAQNQHQQHHPRQLPSHSPRNSYSADQLPPLNEPGRSENVSHTQRTPYSAHPQGSMSRPSNHQSHPPAPPPAAPSPWQQHGPPATPASANPQSQPQPQPPPQYQPPPPPQQDYTARPPYPPRINTAQSHYTQEAGKMHTANTANTATTASAAYSSYEAKPGSRVFLNEDVERSKMLRGAPYNYFDSTLKGERQRCTNALLRYNNACQLGSGISENETQAMLHKVFDPKLDATFNSPVAPRIDGHLGPGVKIEPGFRCTYGYNMRIFDNVFIGENTRVDDSAKVDIGARTWVGANVTILTNDVAKDMTVRKGTDGQQCMAKPVVIGPEVVIGTGAVIMPGVKIGRGATIDPFAHVRTDLVDFAYQRGPQIPPGTGTY